MSTLPAQSTQSNPVQPKNSAVGFAFLAVALFGATAALAQLPAVTFSKNVIDIPGASEVWARGINDFGDVVGFYVVQSGGQFATHGFLRTSLGVIKTIDYPGATVTCLYGINNLGVIAGGAGGGTVNNLGGGCQAANSVAFFYDSKATVPAFHKFLGGPSSFLFEAMGVNDLNEAVGYFDCASNGLCGFYSPNPLATTPTYFKIAHATDNTSMMGINNVDAMSGGYLDAKTQTYHGYVRFGYDPGQVCTVLPACDSEYTLGDSLGGFGINTSFSVKWTSNPYLWAGVAGANDVRLGAALYPVRFTDGTPATAYGINNYGRIAGTFYDSTQNGKKVGFWGDPTAFNPIPAISRINPGSVAVTSSNFQLNVHGTGFVKNSVVRWNGTALATTFNSPQSLSAQVPAGNANTAGTVPITVLSPEPGGGESPGTTFTVLASAPAQTNIPAKPQLAYVPHVVAGGGFTTYVTIINLASTENTVTFNLSGQDGTLQQIQRSVVAPGSSYRIVLEDPGNPATTYWGVVGADQPIAVNVFFELADATGNVVNTVGFNNVDLLSSFTIPVEFEPNPTFRTVGLALANPAASSTTVTLQLLNSGGATIATKTVSLAPYNQQAISLNTAPEFQAVLPASNFLGTLRVTSTAPVAALALGDDVGPFFSTPPISSGRTGQIVIPHIVSGAGFVTKLSLINMSASANSLDVKFYDQAGNLTQQQTVALAANGIARIATPEANRFGASTTTWAVINAAQPAAANVFFELENSNKTVVNTIGFNDSQLTTAGTIPVQFYPGVPSGCPAGHTVGIAIANPGSTSAQVTLKLIDQASGMHSVAPVTIPANGQTAIDLGGYSTFPLTVTSGNNFQGVLGVTSSSPVAVLALGDDCGPFFSTPPIAGSIY